MHTIDWMIMTIPFTGVLALAIYARKYAVITECRIGDV